ncbi:MAG: hypothetical protein M1838_005171, partial [Thelocarpon superellum]
ITISTPFVLFPRRELPLNCHRDGQRPILSSALATSQVAYLTVDSYPSLAAPRASFGHESRRETFVSHLPRSLPQPRLADRQERLGGGDRKRQCPDSRDSRPEDQDPMSRRSTISRPSSASPRSGSQQLPSPQRPLEPPAATASSALEHAPALDPVRPVTTDEPPANGDSSAAPSPTNQPLAPRSPVASVGSSSARSTRASDVHSILNPSPTLAEASVPHGQRRDSSHLHSPQTKLSIPPHAYSALARSPLLDVSAAELSGLSPATATPTAVVTSQAPRRILTPKSPTLRMASFGRTAGPPGTINAQQSPFLSSQGRSYAAEPSTLPGSEAPPMPTPPILSRLSTSSAYGFPTAAPSPPPPGTRRHSTNSAQASHSQSASPSTSYSSYSQPGRTSPAPQFGPLSSLAGSSSLYQAASANGSTLGSSLSGTAGGAFGGSSMNALSQSSYQLLTLDTDQGPIQVPVDVQAASKMADDKRKRNAGASARFRQRRKEKEREASQTIAKLEQRIRDITEEREFFRRQGEHYRQMLVANGTITQPSRPPSPPHLRSGTREAERIGAGPSSVWQGAVPGEAAPAITRRRSDTHMLGQSFALPPLSTTMATSVTPSYTPSPALPQPAFHNHQNLQNHQNHQHNHPTTSAPVTPSSGPTVSPSTTHTESHGAPSQPRFGPGWFPGPDQR